MAESHVNENTCVVCFKNVLYYSIGECDHPVCFECSTRMRVLCVQNECPICRQDLARVVFTESIQPYKVLCNKVFNERPFDRQFRIGFYNEKIKNAYETVLENCCKICDKLPPFRNFSMLNDHMKKVHEKYFCDLCVKHLKIFTSERKCYTRQELAHHRRKGDLDDTSHRGHPLCEFCEQRFMDADELYRHLRKEHLYCHLCDADGKNLYYSTHSALAQHFRTDHYLCEEGECAGDHLTSVFRSEIDLKAHKATVHGRGMGRGAARQTRTLELEFNITPHPSTQRMPRDQRGERNERERDARATVEVPSVPFQRVDPHIDTRSVEQFPRLSAASVAPNLMLTAPVRTYTGSDKLARNDRNFPALDGSNSSRQNNRPTTNNSTGSNSLGSYNAPATVAATIRNSKPSVSIQVHSQPTSASNFRLTQTSGNRITITPQQKRMSLTDDDFPSLSIGKDDHPSVGAAIPQPPKVTLINSQEMQALKNNQSNSQPKKANKVRTEAFPALSSGSSPPPAPATPQWITISKSKEKPKPVNKPEPSPSQQREINFNPIADFPNLPPNNKIKNKKSVPVQPPASPQVEPKSTKKEKKKQNSKKENLIEVPLVNGLDKKYVKDPSYTDACVNNNQGNERDRKIKTVETTPTVTVERKKNGGGDFALTPREYPPLNSRNDINENPPSQPKVYNAGVKNIPNGSVPPGFKLRPACDGMTFTNSSGQTFSAPVHKYIPPPDFENRNRELVKKFVTALGDPDKVESFKVASRAFRDNIIDAEEFYEHCRTALKSQFEEVFPDLVALLPDIGKQQELVVGRNVGLLEVCSTCGQLFTSGDRIAHDTAHWPPLAPR